MALRTIREFGDEVLNKECKEVTKMTLRTKVLINDMFDTMYEANGRRACRTAGWHPKEYRSH